MKNISTLSYIMYIKGGIFLREKVGGGIGDKPALQGLSQKSLRTGYRRYYPGGAGDTSPDFANMMKLENHQFFLKENHIFKWLSCCSHISFLGCSWGGICWWGILWNRFWRRIFDILETQLEMQAERKHSLIDHMILVEKFWAQEFPGLSKKWDFLMHPLWKWKLFFIELNRWPDLQQGFIDSSNSCHDFVELKL